MLLVTAILLMLFVVPPWLGAVLVALALVAEIGELVLWRRFLDRYRVVTGAEGLPGERGEVIEACDPEGSVRIRGEIWKARSEQPLKRGEQIVVDAVDGLTLRVAPAPARQSGANRMGAARQPRRGEA